MVVDAGNDFNFREIPADPGNFDSKLFRTLTQPEYIVMHYTGGTKMDSTINTFTSAPAKPSLGASAHLLVGRDGSVVQFVRFDRIAYHTGFSWWEQQKDLNNFSIGIELDNAGQLVREGDKWQCRLDQSIIPDEEVERSEYWKRSLPDVSRDDPSYTSKLPAFQKFTDVQLAVALNILQVLVKRYPSIKEILGHDQINIAKRMDPGPLLPMKEWRKLLFGREEPIIQEYTITQPTDLFTNVDGELPTTVQSVFPKPLPAEAEVKLLSFEDVGGLTKVTVTNKSAVKGTGWIRSGVWKSLNKGPADQRITTREQTFFKAGDRPPTLRVNQGLLQVNSGLVFPAGTRVRIQEFDGEWALVAMLDRINGRGEADNDHGQGGLEGWVRKEFVSPKAT